MLTPGARKPALLPTLVLAALSAALGRPASAAAESRANPEEAAAQPETNGPPESPVELPDARGGAARTGVGGAPPSEPDPECDRLFGTGEDQEANQALRRRKLVLVEEGPSYIDVVQTGGWDEPEEVAYRGLTLVETVDDPETREPLAVFAVDETLGFCEAGEYEVEIDDSLGAEGRILAILPDLVLVAQGDELRYVRSKDYRGRPTFKVSWRSPFSIVVETKSSGSARSKRVTRRRRRRR